MNDAEPISIIACGGHLAFECIEHARRDGRNPCVIALDGESDRQVTEIADHVLKWGQIGKLIKALDNSGARKVLLVGSITSRPDFRSMIGDLETVRWLPRLIATMAGGDDSVLRKVIGFFESGGYEIVSIAEVAPKLLAPEGNLTRARPDRNHLIDIGLGLDLLKALAPFDVGQSVVVGHGRIAAVEAAEGTDAMLTRMESVRADRRVAWKGQSGILVKTTKEDQDLRVDLPVIGPETVTRCAAAGLSGIAVEASRVVIASQSECIRLADEQGLFLHALTVDRTKPTEG